MTYTETLDLLARLTNTQNTSTSSYTTTAKTVDINNALNRYMMLAISAEGKWQVDDSNQTDYPVVYGDIVSGQQDYSFTTDETGNQILDIYKVRIKDSAGNWKTLTQRDIQSLDDEPLNTTQTGVANQYDLTANGIFLNIIPNYNSTDGLEIYVNRTPTYFLTSDTTKKAGIPWTHHEYLAIRPAYYYCLQKGLPQANALGNEMIRMESSIENYYADRNKDDKLRLTPFPRNYE